MPAKCPKCDEPLTDPKACECGWRSRLRKEIDKAAEQLPHIDCAHEGCPTSARVRIQTPTGWAKFCEPHYLAYHKAIADRKFTELGLDRWPNESLRDWRKRVSEYTKLIVKRSPVESEELAA